MDTLLFRSCKENVSVRLLREALLSVGASNCDVLYIHTDMTFGLPVLGRGKLLAEMLNVLESLDVSTLVFPTFTFSFCNNEPFDVQNSRTPMGALNEYARKNARAVRSVDPLLSVCVLGDTLNLTDDLSEYALGVGSSYDRLHHCGKEVKFLFLGAEMWKCFTYTHYVEAVIGVPYRYNREFTGLIIDEGQERFGRSFLYSSYANYRLNQQPVVHDTMQARGQLCTAPVGDGHICCFRQHDAFETLSEMLTTNALCLTDGSFDLAIQDTTYNADGSRVISVK